MSNSQKVFLQLLQVSLWGKRMEDFQWGEWEKIDWEAVAQLAVEQTQIGLVTDALTRLPKEKRPPKVVFFNLIARVTDIEDENRRMNGIVPYLIAELGKADCQPWLLKGQAVGRCYRKPELRQAGDIDLLLTDEGQYQRATERMQKLTADEGRESTGRQHHEFWFKDILVELHGEFSFIICKQCTRNLPAWRQRHLQEQPVAVSVRENGVVYLPPLMFEVVFVFAHMMNHLMTGGVGLRQVMDCMMLMYRYYRQLDGQQLQEELDFLGLTKFWRVYAAMAVDLLGYPKERMPLYDARFHRQGEKMLTLIFKTGNFGHLQKEKQLSAESNRYMKKLVTAWGQMPVYWRAGKIFPWESLYCFCQYSKRVLFSLGENN